MTVGYSDVLIGLQYGDEGKARVIDALAPHYTAVARFNGGMNAGHTIITDRGKLALRQIPSAVEYKDQLLYIGSGCVVSVSALLEEISSLHKVGIEIGSRLKISPHATLVQPHHILLDQIHGKEIGTTFNGVGPAYADRAFRMRSGVLCNLRAIELVRDTQNVLKIAKHNLDTVLLREPSFVEQGASLLKNFESSLEELAEYVGPADFLLKHVEAGGRVLFEGAQSFMLDVVHGDVPYVTSSHTSVAAAYVGGDLPPKFHRRAIGVVKMIMSRVGNGPFPSEFGGSRSEEYCMRDNGKAHSREFEQSTFNAEQLLSSGDAFSVGQALRMLSGEYGTGSGRPRRVGMLDLQQLKFAARLNGIDVLFINKCDCLVDYAKTKEAQIPIVTEYDQDSQPQIKYYPAFKQDLTGVANFDQLPEGLKSIIADLEASAGCTVVGVGIGPHRNQMVLRDSNTN